MAFGALLVAASLLVAIIGRSDDVAFIAGMAAFSILGPVSVGAIWVRRRPRSRVGSMLVALGGLTAVYSLVNADRPLPYSIGVAAEPLAIGLVFWLLMSLPDGRLRHAHDRALLALTTIGLALLYVPQFVASPYVRSIFPAYDCVTCPANPIHLQALDGLPVATLAWVGTLLLAAAAVALTVELTRRALAARGPRRRTLASITWTSLSLMPALALYLLARAVLQPGDELISFTAVALVVLWFVFPLGFVMPFLAEEIAAAAALRELLGDLSAPRRRDRWRDRLAATLADPELRVAFWDEQSGSFLDRAGARLERSAVPAGRTWLDVASGGRPLAAMLVDSALDDSPEVADAVSVATAAAVEADRIETTRRELLGRAATAAYMERSRMARSVQAGAQQRLAAMRVAVNMATEGSIDDGGQFYGLIARELDAAIGELRRIVWAGGSADVSRRGLGASLRSVTDAAPTTVQVLDRGLQRSHPQSELAVYYCCLEALQNAIKHGGRDTAVQIRVTDAPQGGIDFSVTDDGSGFETDLRATGAGLRSMRERAESVGGWLAVESAPGQGTVVTGWVPSGPGAAHGARAALATRP